MKNKAEMVKLSTIKLNPDNPRRISTADMEKLKKSLKGFLKMLPFRPIVYDRDRIIIGGNMRFLALQQLGYKEVPETWLRCADDFTAEERRQFIITDNGQFGAWDFDALANSWGDLPLADWGVPLPEDWLSAPTGEPADAEPQIDRAEELNKTWRVTLGDLWLIGDHRLLCGDSTKKEDVARVMGGERAILMVTDPPYGVDYDPAWRTEAKRADGRALSTGKVAMGKVQNDDIADWFPAWKLFTGDVVYCWHAGLHASIVQDSLERAGFIMRNQIIWAKPRAPISRGHYNWQHEPCWYAFRKGETAGWIGGFDKTTLWEIEGNDGANPEREGATPHGTRKPLECTARPIRNHESEYIYDPFLGSGTTMVACQNLNRKCRGIEISPAYCSVILQRMTDAFPGIEIRKAE